MLIGELVPSYKIECNQSEWTLPPSCCKLDLNKPVYNSMSLKNRISLVFCFGFEGALFGFVKHLLRAC